MFLFSILIYLFCFLHIVTCRCAGHNILSLSYLPKSIHKNPYLCLLNIDSDFFPNSLVSINRYQIALCWQVMWYCCKDFLGFVMVLKLNEHLHSGFKCFEVLDLYGVFFNVFCQIDFCFNPSFLSTWSFNLIIMIAFLC